MADHKTEAERWEKAAANSLVQMDGDRPAAFHQTYAQAAQGAATLALSHRTALLGDEARKKTQESVLEAVRAELEAWEIPGLNITRIINDAKERLA